jgi:hypothetical protein
MSIDTYPPPGLARASSVLAFVPVEFSQAITAPTAMPGFTATVYVPPGRTLRISGRCYANNNTAGARTAMYINRNGDQKNAGFLHHPTAGVNSTLEAELIDQPPPGVYTYTLSAAPNSGTSTLAGDNNDYQAYLLVEDITGGTGGPGPIVLGHVEDTVLRTTSGTAELTLLSLTVNVSAGRQIKVSGLGNVIRTVGDGTTLFSVKEGATYLFHAVKAGTNEETLNPWRVLTPSAGLHTYTLIIQNYSGTGTSQVGSINGRTQLLVEDVTGTEAPTGAYYEALWTPVTTFTNGWVNYDTANYPPAAYRKVNDLVYLRGLVKSGTLNTPAFVLPAGYRPVLDHHFACLSQEALGGARIFRGGNVTLGNPGSNVWFALDGIVFGVN